MAFPRTQSTAHAWKGPGEEKGLFVDADDSPHVWRKKMPEEENVMADADVPSTPTPTPNARQLAD